MRDPTRVVPRHKGERKYVLDRKICLTLSCDLQDEQDKAWELTI